MLIKKTRFAFSAVPSVNTSLAKTNEAIKGPKRQAFLSNIFSEKFWKSIDGKKTKCLLGNLSP